MARSSEDGVDGVREQVIVVENGKATTHKLRFEYWGEDNIFYGALLAVNRAMREAPTRGSIHQNKIQNMTGQRFEGFPSWDIHQSLSASPQNSKTCTFFRSVLSSLRPSFGRDGSSPRRLSSCLPHYRHDEVLASEHLTNSLYILSLQR